MPTLTPDTSSVSEPTPSSAPNETLPVAVGLGSTSPTDAKTTEAQESSPEVQPVDAKKEPSSLLEAALKAIEPEEKTPVVSSNTTEAPEKPTESSPASKEDETTPVDDSKLPFHEHPRWKEVLSERDSYKDAAARFGHVVNYMQQNNLTSDEFERGAHIMAVMKRSPLEALELLRPTWESLQRFAGEALPQDLATKVEQGFVDEASAREMAKYRNQAAFSQNQQEQQRQAYAAEQQRLAQEQAQVQQEQHTATLYTAVNSWEEATRKRDADYAQKETFIGDRYRVLIAQTPPRTTAEAVQLAERAYADVNERMKPLSSRRQPVRTVSSTASTASAATQAPRSFREAAEMALRR